MKKIVAVILIIISIVFISNSVAEENVVTYHGIVDDVNIAVFDNDVC